jgi:predicted  nucleic acid-binding Zn-ribbon protein
MNARAVIGGKEYYRISAPQISHSLATEPLSIGNCNAASLKLDVLLENGEEIPEAASVRIIAQLTDLDVTRRTEVLPFGEFWVDTCTGSENLYTLSCYDAMLKTSQAMVDDSDSESDWPKSMAVVVQEIAYRIGTPLDPRTRINRGLNYMVPYPKGYTMQQILGWIGACNGGNWTITDEGMLRLVTLTAPPTETYRIVDDSYNDIITGDGYALAWKLSSGSGEAQTPETGSGVGSLVPMVYPVVDHEFNRIVTADGFTLVYDKTGAIEAEQGLIHVPFVRGPIITGKRLVVSKVTMTDEEGNSYSQGDDSGFEITVDNCPYSCQGICNDLYSMLHGIEYEPFTATDAVFDPATELGDQVKIGDQVHSSIYSMEATLDIGYANTISAPTNTEATRQYPYLTNRDKNRDKVFLEMSADYGGVAMSADDGLVVTKTGSAGRSASAQALTAARSTPVSRAEVQYSDEYISMRARDPETGHMEDCIFFDDDAEKYHITKSVLIEQADELAEELKNLSDELKSMEGGEGADAVTLPQLMQAVKDVQTALTEQHTTLEGLETSTADVKKTLAAIQTALSDIKTAADGIRSVVDKNTTTLAAVKDAQTADRKLLDGIQADTTALTKAIALQSEDVSKVHATVNEHTASLTAMDEKLTAVQDAQTADREVLDNVQADTTALKKSAADQSAELATIQTDVTALKQAVATQSAEMSKVHTTVDGHTASLTAMDEKLTAAQETLDSIFSLLKTMSGSKDTETNPDAGTDAGTDDKTNAKEDNL